VDGKKAAPDSIAERTSAASKADRDSATPPWSFTTADRLPAARKSECNGDAPTRSVNPSRPAAASADSARGLMQQPQTFERGNAQRSTSRTAAPRRAS
jgi:hypothetical protein